MRALYFFNACVVSVWLVQAVLIEVGNRVAATSNGYAQAAIIIGGLGFAANGAFLIISSALRR